MKLKKKKNCIKRRVDVVVEEEEEEKKGLPTVRIKDNILTDTPGHMPRTCQHTGNETRLNFALCLLNNTTCKYLTILIVV